MDNLKIKFEFEEISPDDLKLVIEVLGQIFSQVRRVVITGNKKVDITRHKSEVFGNMLKDIAESIIIQAKYDKPGKIVQNGIETKLF